MESELTAPKIRIFANNNYLAQPPSPFTHGLLFIKKHLFL